jgi:hypothetical protein
MWSGGAITSVQEYNDGLKRLEELQKQLGDLLFNQGQAQQKASDAQTNQSLARQQEYDKKAEDIRLKNQCFADERELQGAEDNRQSSFHQNQQASEALVPEWTRVCGLFDMARFFQWRFDLDFRGAYEKACLEAISENENWGGACLVAWMAGCLKMSGAELGIRSTLNFLLEAPKYLKVADVIRNQAPDYLAQARTAHVEFADKQASLARRSASDAQHYQKIRDEKAERVARSQKDAAIAKSAYRTAENAVKSGTAVVDTTRKESDDQSLAVQALRNQIEALRTDLQIYGNNKEQTQRQRRA